MELEGTIIFDLPLQEGVSKAGRPWKKKEWVLETPGMYPRRVKFHVFGDRVDMLNFEVGKSYAVTFELESREFNGRWYTDVNVLAARPTDGAMAGQPVFSQPASQPSMGSPMQQPASVAPAPDPFAGADNNTDDLPF
jgi:hypothetical protein